MALKQAILDELGGQALLSPDRIARSLGANDQVKYYFALLQSARENAERPRVPVLDLKAERIASQLSDAWLDDVVGGTRKDASGNYRIPHGPEILRRIETSVRTMLECLPDDRRKVIEERATALALPAPEHGAISGKLIATITSGDRKAGDSLHLVVMDAHRAINRLQSETAVETVAGARTHSLSTDARRWVEVFMRGLNRTAPLKFDHPGLGTTATEHQGRLLIQNDIGTTDAHVLVVRIEELVATLTYTDIHAPRLKFFQSLFGSFDVVWSTTEERHSDKLTSREYMLTTGRFEARDDAAFERYIEHLGSRIVFLIDWNRMRKRLRAFVSKSQAIAVLKWAADNEYGHRALLEVGGERALADAVEYAAGPKLRYGQRLDDLLSPERAVEFLKDALKLASLGLRQRRSRRSINDEIKATLKGCFENERLRLFDLAADHAAIGYDLALALVEALTELEHGASDDSVARLSGRAVCWERRADHLLNEARDDIKRFTRPSTLTEFMERCDDAVDELEEAAALLELMKVTTPDPQAVARLRLLAEKALISSQEVVKCIECAASISSSDVRDDLDEFIESLERLMAIEHTADDMLRDFRRRLVEGSAEARQLLVLRELSGAIETATDAHVHAGQALRMYLMEEVIV
jgi:uncharacterized protein Yka (UPF0111/DUF47 family)